MEACPCALIAGNQRPAFRIDGVSDLLGSQTLGAKQFKMDILAYRIAHSLQLPQFFL
ncbi:hypothetical protein J21TS3_07380 [Paenibacillus cookii]|uniref:Uncharacterized protein n=1 Tax=Paenibacillus cookii TaxID=157839 RepID=A0ABQ4LRP3_9BACL|nr:hypothetical protein J21TS3_07380 [Paenibacillus cookii]